jgi:hypothetical protein
MERNCPHESGYRNQGDYEICVAKGSVQRSGEPQIHRNTACERIRVALPHFGTRRARHDETVNRERVARLITHRFCDRWIQPRDRFFNFRPTNGKFGTPEVADTPASGVFIAMRNRLAARFPTALAPRCRKQAMNPTIPEREFIVIRSEAARPARIPLNHRIHRASLFALPKLLPLKYNHYGQLWPGESRDCTLYVAISEAGTGRFFEDAGA